MGFGFNLFCVFLLLPLTFLLLVAWGVTKKDVFAKIIGFVWGSLLLLFIVVPLIEGPTRDNLLEKEDFYGEYIIDRDYFPGKQADWQYASFRFTISHDDIINFYVMHPGSKTKVFRGFASTVKPYQSARLVFNMEQPTHHIITTNPTIYRRAGNFYLVFNSPKFGNVFFKKGEWKALTK